VDERRIAMVELTEASIDTNSLLQRSIHADCGAVVLFLGTTRRWTGDLETTQLEYTAYHAMALAEMQSLEQIARSRWPLKEIQIVHRLGEVPVGEISVAIAVSSPHRQEAFEAGQWLIDTLKHTVPIWKRENWKDKGISWVHPNQEEPK